MSDVVCGSTTLLLLGFLPLLNENTMKNKKKLLQDEQRVPGSLQTI